MPSLRLAAALLLAVALAACAGLPRPEEAVDGSGAPFGALTLFTPDNKPLVPPPGATIAGATVPLAATTRDLNVLAISGGGSDGAFGAGVLKGWTKSGKRPEFNIVTGVSTGALLASYAFLGPSWDHEVERFYTRIKDEDIYVSKGIAGLFEDSLYDASPLRHLVEQAVDQRLIDAVAAEHAKGRRLYVATTDLDTGTVVVWDMGGIAASGHADRLKTYRDVLIASAAFPGFFEPVYVHYADQGGKARMHVDGGVKAPVLLRSFMVEGPQRKKNVYLLINGKMSLKTEAPAVQATVTDISKRSISELMRGLTYKTVYQAYVTTTRAKGQFHLLFVPDDEHEIQNPLSFKQAEMRRLFAAGERIGSDPSRWLKEPPRLEPLERVTQR